MQRPSYHITAGRGWINDPCAPGYNKASGTYHLGFQWNPNGNSWGNISWGVALSRDLVRWEVQSEPSLKPSKNGDCDGVFTGSLIPCDVDSKSNGTLTCFYTAVCQLPLHYSLPYTYGAEKVHAAISRDDGRSWSLLATNPVVPSPPYGYSVTAWRDPFVTKWSAMDQVLGKSLPSFYGIVAGGLRLQTPTLFLYEIDASAVDRWTFVATLVDFGLNFSLSRWSPDFGRNFEVSNLVSIRDEDGASHDFMVVGAEGLSRADGVPKGNLTRRDYQQMWFAGVLSKTRQGVKMRFQYGGCLDYGCLYATSTFFDPVIEAYVAFGWIREELSDELIENQDWCGALSVPRVLGFKKLHSVTGTIKTPLGHITNINVIPVTSAESTVNILTITADARLRSLRGPQLSLTPSTGLNSLNSGVFFPDEVQGARSWELEVTWDYQEATQLGFEIGFAKDFHHYARIYFDVRRELVCIDRRNSSVCQGISRADETAPHTLFTFRDPATNETSVEQLKICAFYDASILEVFVNNRTVITTRLYPESDHCFGVRPYCKTLDDNVTNLQSLRSFQLWPILDGGIKFRTT